MDSYLIQVQPQDELTVIIDKIMHTQAERVYVLIPDNSRISHHVLNFRLLKREADSLDKEIIIVSSSPRIQNLALKSQLKAHQETKELKQGVQQENPDVLQSPPLLSDIIAPEPEEDLENKPVREKKKETVSEETETKNVVEDEQKDLSETQVGKIASFWTKRKEHPKETKREEVHKKVKPKKLTLKGMAPISSLFSKKFDVFGGVKKINIPKKFSTPEIKWNRAKVFRNVLITLTAVSSLIVALTFYSVLPSAKIYLTPITEEIMLEIDVVGDANVADTQPEKLILPAQIFEKSIEATRIVMSTGEREVINKAGGIIDVYNSFSSSPQTLVKTTRFVSEGGKLFRTTQTIVVSGAKIEDGKIVASFTAVDVEASEPGEEYNIGPSTFSIPGFKGTPKYLAFYGKSKRNMKGGKIGTEQVVTGDDYEKAQNDLENEIKKKAARGVELLMPEGFVIPGESSSMSLIAIDSTASAGDVAREFTITGTTDIKAFAIREADVSDLLINNFDTRFPGKKPLAQKREIMYQVESLDFDKGILKVKISLSQYAATIINESEIRDGMIGKEENVVRAFLSARPDIKEAKVTFWPFWVKKIPDDPSKIDIIINEDLAP